MSKDYQVYVCNENTAAAVFADGRLLVAHQQGRGFAYRRKITFLDYQQEGVPGKYAAIMSSPQGSSFFRGEITEDYKVRAEEVTQTPKEIVGLAGVVGQLFKKLDKAA